jgi:hypothetical protein
MLGEWRTAGHGHDEIELWVIGRAGQEGEIPALTGGTDSAMFVDVTDPLLSAFAAYSAINDDLFIIDSTGNVAGHWYLVTTTLSDATNRANLDLFVLSLLP